MSSNNRGRSSSLQPLRQGQVRASALPSASSPILEQAGEVNEISMVNDRISVLEGLIQTLISAFPAHFSQIRRRFQKVGGDFGNFPKKSPKPGKFRGGKFVAQTIYYTVNTFSKYTGFGGPPLEGFWRSFLWLFPDSNSYHVRCLS